MTAGGSGSVLAGGPWTGGARQREGVPGPAGRHIWQADSLSGMNASAAGMVLTMSS